MTIARVRAWWLRRQRLTPETSPATVEQCVSEAGWLATAGAQGAYLSVCARMPEVTRDTVDRAAVDGVPLIDTIGTRGTAFLVPREDLALALRAVRVRFQKSLSRLFRTGEISQRQLHAVGDAICRVLDEGPLATAAIRERVTHARAGELAAAARQMGLSTGVALALRDLMLRGIVRRIPIDGRLDSASYVFELLHPDDRPSLDAEGDDTDVARKLAQRFLRWNGPATLDEVAWWADLTKTRAKAALHTSGAISLEVSEWADHAWILPEDADSLRSTLDRIDDRVVLLPFRDPFVYARRGPAVLCADDAAPVLDWKARAARIGDVDSLHHHAIVYRAELVGVWEYDVGEGAIITRVWPTNRRVRALVREAAHEKGAFIREQLGDAKFYALDAGAGRAERLAFCRDQ